MRVRVTVRGFPALGLRPLDFSCPARCARRGSARGGVPCFRGCVRGDRERCAPDALRSSPALHLCAAGVAVGLPRLCSGFGVRLSRGNFAAAGSGGAQVRAAGRLSPRVPGLSGLVSRQLGGPVRRGLCRAFASWFCAGIQKRAKKRSYEKNLIFCGPSLPGLEAKNNKKAAAAPRAPWRAFLGVLRRSFGGVFVWMRCDNAQIAWFDFPGDLWYNIYTKGGDPSRGRRRVEFTGGQDWRPDPVNQFCGVAIKRQPVRKAKTGVSRTCSGVNG